MTPGARLVPEAGAPIAQERCIHELFEEQVERTPAAIAVRSEQELSYRELNRRANQLAHYLRRLGVGPNALVGLRVERSAEMLVALLAILKAGGACIPMEADDATERLGFCLEDMGLKLLLTRQHLGEMLGCEDKRVLLERAAWDEIAKEREDDPTPVTNAGDLAWVIVQSGRGVSIEHRGVVARVLNVGKVLELSSRDAILQRTSFRHDAALWELLAPLLHGGTVVLSPTGHGLGGVARVIVEHAITVARLTSAEMGQLPVDRLAGAFRVVLCDGPDAKVEELSPMGFPVYHFYSVPEAGVVAGKLLASDERRVFTTVRVLDRNRQLVPVGLPGEVYVGGAGLARPYLGDPLAAEERFIKDPFTDGRLFATGDLGRWRSDRTLEIIGAVRLQVWIDGERIDLEDVEAALLEEPSVASCAVRARHTKTGAILVAYIVTSGRWSRQQVERHAETRLPGPCRPSAYVPVRSLPITPTGQIDEKALAEVELIDDELLVCWEDRLRSVPGVEDVAVLLVEDRIEQRPPETFGDRHPAGVE